MDASSIPLLGGTSTPAEHATATPKHVRRLLFFVSSSSSFFFVSLLLSIFVHACAFISSFTFFSPHLSAFSYNSTQFPFLIHIPVHFPSFEVLLPFFFLCFSSPRNHHHSVRSSLPPILSRHDSDAASSNGSSNPSESDMPPPIRYVTYFFHLPLLFFFSARLLFIISLRVYFIYFPPHLYFTFSLLHIARIFPPSTARRNSLRYSYSILFHLSAPLAFSGFQRRVLINIPFLIPFPASFQGPRSATFSVTLTTPTRSNPPSTAAAGPTTTTRPPPSAPNLTFSSDPRPPPRPHRLLRPWTTLGLSLLSDLNVVLWTLGVELGGGVKWSSTRSGSRSDLARVPCHRGQNLSFHRFQPRPTM